MVLEPVIAVLGHLCQAPETGGALQLACLSNLKKISAKSRIFRRLLYWKMSPRTPEKGHNMWIEEPMPGALLYSHTFTSWHMGSSSASKALARPDVEVSCKPLHPLLASPQHSTYCASACVRQQQLTQMEVESRSTLMKASRMSMLTQAMAMLVSRLLEGAL